MAIFRRNRREGDASAVDRAPADRDLDEPDATESADPADAPDAADAPEPVVDRADGPFDAAEADDAERLDLGALRIVGAPGMHLQLELDESTQAVVSATVTVGGSAVQLQAFAAPRTTRIWPEIRQEIAASLVTGGGTADVVDGPLGRELMGRMPGRGADGRTAFSPVRFLGIDGPRW
ncbi:MAG TPA: DUF3710 domain-containing protein, partial [Candidatus Lustribacter sp.]|nr:DUF3710 domain-containing protein [Candidatus Lustribacter sp.]